ncbi:MAG TPA: hypothetical protein VFK50_05275 [Sphingomicrobium sp.]|nr:hypothetical protein [Sphingomicrobium sp.]
MRTFAHPAAVSPLNFGRRMPSAGAAPPAAGVGEDLRLFLWTFTAGFLAVSIYLA